jgi:hypothetical protein
MLKNNIHNIISAMAEPIIIVLVIIIIPVTTGGG